MGAEEVDLKARVAGSSSGVSMALSPAGRRRPWERWLQLSTSALRPEPGLQSLAHLADGAQRIGRIGEVAHLDVIVEVPLPGTILGEPVPPEQVMTRQPAEAKRLTVAWPMPRARRRSGSGSCARCRGLWPW